MTEILFALLFLLPPWPAAAARPAAVAGTFYPADPAALSARVDSWLAAPKGFKPEPGVKAILAPHAGYDFSGPMAGLAYRHAGDSYDTVVVLATGHTEGVKGAALLASDAYETPLGKVEPDRELAAALMKTSPLFEDRPSAHRREHAVEVQLPFLQRRLKKPFKLLPAVLNTTNLGDLKKIGAALAAALKGRRALIVISADFSHYPPRDVAGAADRTMALAIASMDPALVQGSAAMMSAQGLPGLETCACGEAAVIAGMEAARLLGARSFLALKVSDSYAENPRLTGPSRVVGYISGLFLKKGEPPALDLKPAQKEALLKEARRELERAFSRDNRPAALDPDPRLNLPGAAFVTLKKNGALRGCVGTVEPAMTLANAVRYGAYSAAFRDGRFSPVEEEELRAIKVEVSVLSPMRPVKAADIKPWKHGVLAVAGRKSGLFLPQVWEQIPDKEEFLAEICSQKAGLPRDCWKDPATSLYYFTVDAFEE